MEGKTHLVAFIDILGFRDLTNKYFSGVEKGSLEQLINALKSAEEYAINYNRNYLKNFEIEFSFKQFSDCVSISIPLEQKNKHELATIYGAFFNVVRMYQLILMSYNILIRGGISIGQHFENDNMIFSEALIKAYKLETEKAIYPRIVVDNELLKMILASMKKDPAEFPDFYMLFGRALITDWDNVVFLSPFGFIAELKYFKKRFGSEILNYVVSLYGKSSNNDDLSKGEFIQMLDEDEDVDKESVNMHLLQLIAYFKANRSTKSEVNQKRKWLVQFMKWYIEPKKSRIKFERYLKRHLEQSELERAAK